MTLLTILNGLNDVKAGIIGIFYPFRDGKFIGFGHWIENIAYSPFQIAGGITKVSGGLIGGGFQWLGDKIGGDVGDFISGRGNDITNISTGIGNTIMDIGEGTIDGVKNIGKGIKKVWNSIF